MKLSNDVVQMLMQRLITQGKPIEAGWLLFRFRVMPEDCGIRQVRDMRIAYFAGARHLIKMVENTQVLGCLIAVDNEIGSEADKRRSEVEQVPSTTCPRCGFTSYNPNDIREKYCVQCHDWTGE